MKDDLRSVIESRGGREKKSQFARRRTLLGLLPDLGNGIELVNASFSMGCLPSAGIIFP